jgi:DNA-binding PadR family transcriptional regulator
MTNAELAILSLVAEKPRHGYQIEQVIEERGMREWTEVGFSSIYYLLKKLGDQDLIEGKLEETDRGPARKVYSITRTGQVKLQEGLIQALSTPRRCYPAIQLGLANLPSIPDDESHKALLGYQKALIDRLAKLKTEWESQKPLPMNIDTMFEYSLTMIQAELDWLERFIFQLRTMKNAPFDVVVDNSK